MGKKYLTLRGRKLRLSGGIQFDDFKYEAKNAMEEKKIEEHHLFRNGTIYVVPDGPPPPDTRLQDAIDENARLTEENKAFAIQLRKLSAAVQSLGGNVAEILGTAGAGAEGGRASAPGGVPGDETTAEAVKAQQVLQRMGKDDLVAKCNASGLLTTGNKADLVARLVFEEYGVDLGLAEASDAIYQTDPPPDPQPEG